MATLFFGFEEWTFSADALAGTTDAAEADTEQAAALRELLASSSQPLPATGWRLLHESSLAATFGHGELDAGMTIAWLEWFQPSFMRDGRDSTSVRDLEGQWLSRGVYPGVTRLGVAPPIGTTRCHWWLRDTARPDSRTIDVYATDPTCASGRPTGDRLREPVVDLGEHEVLIAFAATRLHGAQTCPSHPPTPYTVTLDRPLDDRVILDGGWWPPRPPEPRTAMW